jgi:hypothetical protein
VYRALLNALSNGRRVSSTEVALYFLEGQDGILKYSRKCVNVNTNQKHDLDLPLNIDLEDAPDGNGLAVATGYHVNMRTRYSTFCQCQLGMHGHNNVSLFSFVTSFSAEKPLPALSNGRTRPEARIPLFLVDEQTGEVTNRVSFEHDNIRFVAIKRCNVVHISPWFKMDFSLECCRKLLFLFVPWPNGNEELYQDPIHSWHDLSPPGYATVCINREIHRQQLSVAMPVANDIVESDAEMHGPDDDNGDVIIEDYVDRIQLASGRQGRTCHGMSSVSVVEAATLNDAKSYLTRIKQRLTDESSATSRLTVEQVAMKDSQPFSIIPYDDYDTKMILLQQLISDLTPDQNHIFSKITTHIMDLSRGQLVGLVSGEGGTGKTQVMKVIKMWCESIYGKVQGEVGCCAIGAPTGPAAFNVGGNTWQVGTQFEYYPRELAIL